MTSPSLKRPINANVSDVEYQLLQELRERSPAQQPLRHRHTLGDRISDRVATVMGSWPFIIVQSCLLASWVVLNVIALIKHWDPYPFILLNLVLSFQSAYAAPIIMMSQNRQASTDRQDAKHDYEINMKAELEIELLHDQMNLLREKEMVTLLALLKDQQQRLQRVEAMLQQEHSHGG